MEAMEVDELDIEALDYFCKDSRLGCAYAYRIRNSNPKIINISYIGALGYGGLKSVSSTTSGSR